MRMEPAISEVTGACSNDCATEAPYRIAKSWKYLNVYSFVQFCSNLVYYIHDKITAT
jgi:hypothetical protein